MHNLKKKNRFWIYFTFYVVSILVIAAAFGINRIYLSDFYAINGDFQNFNIFRRILDGQFSYSDFANYLGMGVVLINVPLLLINGSFTASLFVTNFTSCIIFAVIVTLLVYLCTKNKYAAMAVGAVSPFFSSVCLSWEATEYLNNGFKLVEPGNSMRTTRSLLPYLIVIIFLIAVYIYGKRKGKSFSIIENVGNAKFTALCGAVIGMLVFWSNDFGFACVGSATALLVYLMLFTRSCSRKKKFGAFCAYAGGGVAGAVVSAFLISGGDIASVIEFTLGVAGYQYWYYGNTMFKIMTAGEFFGNYYYNWVLVFFLIYLMVLIYRTAKKQLDNFDVLTAFVYMSTVAASVIYAYGSGGRAFEAAFLATTFIVICYGVRAATYVVKYFISRKNSPRDAGENIFKGLEKGICVVFLCFAVFTGGLYGAFSAARLFGEREGTYVENLGGYTPYGDSIIQASNLIGGEEIFSTYASAIEANTGKFQPSGIDYIIHVLGDEEREEYVENFVTGEYKYASTIRGDYTVYEDWVRRTNWFFYRELYKNYQPVLVTDYSLIWERTEDTNKIETPVEAGVGRINGDTSVIRVRLPEYDGKAIVDLKISYETEWDGDWLKELAFKRMATVIDRNAGETVIYNLPAETEETYIPVVVEDGYASITIMSRPDECSRLENLKVEAGWVYDYDTVTVEYTERG